MAVKRKTGLKTTCTRTKKQQLKDKQNDNDRDWAAGLPDHLLELMIERLLLVDCLSFISVCKEWKRITTEFFKGSSRVIPLLVKSRQSGEKTKTCINVLDKSNKNSTFDIPMSEEYIGSYIWGSYRDWLFLARPFEKHVHITLVNPFSGEKVVLPNTCNDYHMVVLSSVPSDPKCIFMIVHRILGVAFWTSSAPRDWRKCDNLMGSKHHVDALYHEGHFYILNRFYEIVIIDGISVVNMLNNTDEDNDKSSIATQYLQLRAPCSGYTRKYIVESNGDILLMSRIFYEGFETYRLDISEMVWVKLERLGNNNQVVFLGRSCSRSFNTKEIGVGGGEDDALANKIYFSNNRFTNRINEWEKVGGKYIIDWNLRDDYEWGVFRLPKESSDWPRIICATAKFYAGIWVMAPISWCFRQMLLKRG